LRIVYLLNGTYIKMHMITDVVVLTQTPSKSEDWPRPACSRHAPNIANLEDGSLSDDLFKQWVSMDLPDRILVDRQGKVLWCRILNAMMECDDDDTVSLKRVRVGGTLPTGLLTPILLAGTLAQPGQSRVALVERKDIRKNIVARVVPLGQDKTGPFGITVSSRQGFSSDTRMDLKRIWDLSPSESRILSLTFQGLTVHEVSDITALSVETVRTHIRHVYTKVGVNSRESLFATIGPLLN
jgi:DNA-binding CsgD family transcriptional regulator